jgi:glycosyltransferase involved in cell wall biosynthesis
MGAVRIVQVSPWFYPHLGGVESHVMGLSREFASRGHEVTVVTTRHTLSAPERETMDGFDVVRVKPRMIVLRTPIAPRIRTLLRGLPADVVHAHLPPPLSAHYAADAAAARGVPLVLTYHCDVEIPSPLGSLVETLYRRSLGASTLERAAKVIVTTRTYAATSRAVWRHDPAVIPNAVDVHRFSPELDGKAVRQKLKLRPDRPVALLVGRIVAHKGVEHFIEAARYLPGVQFLVAGEGASLETMERLAETLGVKDRVRFLGRISQDNLPKVYAACDLFVLPSVSRLEAFGIVALEAMATGKPVVVADIPGVREVIEDGREGLLADPVNPQDLAEKMRRLVEDPALREEMGRRGREKVLASFTTEKVADRILDVYADVLSKARATARP